MSDKPLPVLLMQEHKLDDEQIRAKVWCPFCVGYHYHGWKEGVRQPHCEQWGGQQYRIVLPDSKKLGKLREESQDYYFYVNNPDIEKP